MELAERPRRLRATPNLRRLVRETRVTVDDLIYPLFVTDGTGVRDEIGAMPGIYRHSVDRLLEEVGEIAALGIPGVLLFGVPADKTPDGSGAWESDGVVQRAVKATKSAFPELIVATDVCLCGYTSHGHCGAVEAGKVLNDPTVELLAKVALSHAEAGADVVAPSDMMDARVGAIRMALERAGHTETIIMAYSAKYASAYYGPFREAAASAPKFGDRKAYQMDPANGREALREVALDVAEGADIIMVKPALAYLDIIRDVSQAVDLPVAAYNVSGEYAMVKAAARQGWIDERNVVLETLGAIKRAGAKIILTYHAKDAARWLSPAADTGEGRCDSHGRHSR